MDFIHKTEDIGRYVVEMRQQKYSPSYIVSLLGRYDEARGYVIKENHYPTKEKANRRYRDLKRQAKEMMI